MPAPVAHRSGSRPATAATLAAMFALLTPSSAPAQSRPQVWVTPVVGLADAVGALPNAPVLSSGSLLSFEDFGAMATAGAEVEVAWGDAPLRLRIGVFHGWGADATAQWGCPAGVACAAILIRVPARLSVSAAGADVVWSLVRIGAGEIYPVAGVGWVRHRFEWEDADLAGFPLSPHASSLDAATARIGAGVAVTIGGVRASAEYGESIAFTGAAELRPDRVRTARIGVGLRAF